MKRSLLILLGAAVMAGGPVYAHHSFAASYIEEQIVSIEGRVLEFQLRNPHSILLLTVSDDGGVQRTYSAEWGGLSRLSRQSITTQTLNPGDYVVITGSPSRQALEYKIHLKGIYRPADGWSWGRARQTSRARTPATRTF